MIFRIMKALERAVFDLKNAHQIPETDAENMNGFEDILILEYRSKRNSRCKFPIDMDFTSGADGRVSLTQQRDVKIYVVD
jgi:hypothetical protein